MAVCTSSRGPWQVCVFLGKPPGHPGRVSVGLCGRRGCWARPGGAPGRRGGRGRRRGRGPLSPGPAGNFGARRLPGWAGERPLSRLLRGCVLHGSESGLGKRGNAGAKRAPANVQFCWFQLTVKTSSIIWTNTVSRRARIWL